MLVQSRTFPNSYRDSVELMQIAAEIESLAGINRAGLVMATPANREVLAAAGLLSEAAASAGPNDLVVAVASDDENVAAQALERAAERLAGPGAEGPSESTRTEVRTLAEGVAEVGANLALISTPGTYATAEALKALKHGLNVFLFSDNVPVEDEIELKSMARSKGPPHDGPGLRYRNPGWRSARVRQCRPTRDDRADRRVWDRPATGELPHRSLRCRGIAGHRRRRTRSGRTSRRHDDAGGARAAGRRSRDRADRPHLEAAVRIGDRAGPRRGKRGREAGHHQLPRRGSGGGHGRRSDPGGDVRGGRDDRQRDGAGTTRSRTTMP